MIKHFLSLEWKAFIRSAAFKTNLALKILMIIGALFMILYALGLGVGAYFLIEKYVDPEPLNIINKIVVFYLVVDLALRFFLQKMPIVNIKPLLYLPLKKDKVVRFGIHKTMVSFFNIWHAFFFIPFSIVLVVQGYPFLNVLSWHIAMLALIYCNNFIIIFINSKASVFYSVLGVLALLGTLWYFNIFDITQFTAPVFASFYSHPYLVIIPIVLSYVLYKMAFNYFRKTFT